MNAEREWWRRVPRVLVRPRGVFEAVAVEDPDDVVARQEPVLAIVLGAGMTAVLLSPVWGRLLDDPEIDWLLVAVLTFVAGGIYGAAGYFLIGLALHLGVKGATGRGPFRRARHTLAFSCVPLAAALPLVLLLEIAVFGDDAFRRGGSDTGAAGAVLLAVELAFVGWTVGLIALGVSVVYRLSWAHVVGALALTLLVLAAFVAVPSLL